MDSPQPDYYATTTTDAIAVSSQHATTSSFSIVTPLLISFAGVTVTLLLLLAYQVAIAKFCPRRPSTGGRKRGVEERVLDSIPVLAYSKEDNNGAGPAVTPSDDCVICIGELEEGETVRFLPSCGHVFHASCVDNWFSAHSSCPTCRAPVLPPSSADVRKTQVSPNTAAGDRLGTVGDYRNCLARQGSGSILREGQIRNSLRMKRSRSMDDWAKGAQNGIVSLETVSSAGPGF